MDALCIISKEANDLFRESFVECCRIRDEITALKDFDQNNKRFVIGKKQLMDSAQLSGQIIRALDDGCLLLALIGLRALTENYINTKYTFAHPKKVHEQINWANQVCDNYFKQGNNPKAIKNYLNQENIEKRAEDSGLNELYEKDFVSLCNYTHMTIHTGNLNNQKILEDFTCNAYVSTLTKLHDIRDFIQEHFNIKGWDKHTKRVEEFSNKYFTDK